MVGGRTVLHSFLEFVLCVLSGHTIACYPALLCIHFVQCISNRVRVDASAKVRGSERIRRKSYLF